MIISSYKPNILYYLVQTGNDAIHVLAMCDFGMPQPIKLHKEKFKGLTKTILILCFFSSYHHSQFIYCLCTLHCGTIMSTSNTLKDQADFLLHILTPLRILKFNTQHTQSLPRFTMSRNLAIASVFPLTDAMLKSSKSPQLISAFGCPHL